MLNINPNPIVQAAVKSLFMKWAYFSSFSSFDGMN
jgi:hypothetical protein